MKATKQVRLKLSLFSSKLNFTFTILGHFTTLWIKLIQVHHLQFLLEPPPSALVLCWHVTSGTEGLVLTVWRQTHVSSSDVQLAQPDCQRHQCHCLCVFSLSLPLLPLSVQLHPERRGGSHFSIWPCDDTSLTHGRPAYFTSFYLLCVNLARTFPDDDWRDQAISCAWLHLFKDFDSTNQIFPVVHHLLNLCTSSQITEHTNLLTETLKYSDF